MRFVDEEYVFMDFIDEQIKAKKEGIIYAILTVAEEEGVDFRIKWNQVFGLNGS